MCSVVIGDSLSQCEEWCDGSCMKNHGQKGIVTHYSSTNSHDKCMDTSIQVLCWLHYFVIFNNLWAKIMLK